MPIKTAGCKQRPLRFPDAGGAAWAEDAIPGAAETGPAPGDNFLKRRNKLNPAIPQQMFFTKGVGTHREQLHSFELALRDAGIEKCNLVQVSSILPPGCKIISRAEGLKS